jgi:hypothetical protein
MADQCTTVQETGARGGVWFKVGPGGRRLSPTDVPVNTYMAKWPGPRGRLISYLHIIMYSFPPRAGAHFLCHTLRDVLEHTLMLRNLFQPSLSS